MRLKDPIIEDMIKHKTELPFGDVKLTVVPNPMGTCDGCYFLDSKKNCPNRAVTICCSNGGNIFKLVENKE